MVLVISNIAIEAAPALVNLFPAGAAALVTASDLYRSFKAGVSLSDLGSSRLIVGDREILFSEITGIITTVPSFLPVEFYYVAPEDRDYICAEVNAFFQYLLNEIPCQKCNPPDWKTFAAGNVHKLEWMKIAMRLNIPLASFHIKNGYPVRAKQGLLPVPYRCTVIFDEIVNTKAHRDMQCHTLALAKAMSLSYLDCYFSVDSKKGYLLEYINTVPDVSLPANRQAIADHFLKVTVS